MKSTGNVGLIGSWKYDSPFSSRFPISMKTVQREVQYATDRITILHPDTKKAQKIRDFPQLCAGSTDGVFDRFEYGFFRHTI